MNPETTWKLYKITNNINGKIYIGQTIQAVKLRFSNHCDKSSCCTYLRNAIQKHGKQNFTTETICTVYSQQDADLLEQTLIKAYNTTNAKYGYNLAHGGKGPGIMIQDTKNKISAKLKGRNLSEKTKQKISQSMLGNQRNKGKIHTEITKSKISKHRLGMRLTIETKKKISESKKNCTDETRKKLSKAQLGKPAHNRKLSWYDAQAVRFYYSELHILLCALSQQFGVGTSTIYRIITNESYTIKEFSESSYPQATVQAHATHVPPSAPSPPMSLVQ